MFNFQLPIDNLYMLTIKNIVRQHVDIMKAHRSAQDTMSAGALVNKAQCNWEETDTISDTINSIKKLLLSVSSYQTAMTCTSWIVKELPMGNGDFIPSSSPSFLLRNHAVVQCIRCSSGPVNRSKKYLQTGY